MVQNRWMAHSTRYEAAKALSAKPVLGITFISKHLRVPSFRSSAAPVPIVRGLVCCGLLLRFHNQVALSTPEFLQFRLGYAVPGNSKARRVNQRHQFY